MNIALLSVLGAVVVLGSIDIYLVFKKGSQYTISVQLYLFCQQNPVVAFALGFLFGHLMWKQ
jgi:hypothetical protein